MLDRYSEISDEQVVIRFTEGEMSFAEISLHTLQAELPELMERFHVEEYPRVRIVLVPNRDEFDRLVRDLLKVEIEVPSHPARIAQPQRTDMVVLSPSAYEEHSTFVYVQEEFERLLVHEAVHMIEEFLSPNIEASPRWWGEGLAVFFSNQWRHEDAFRKAALDGIAAGEIPSLEQVENEARHAYDWGWTIVAFIEDAYGHVTIERIIRECTDGDVLAFLPVDRATLKKRWRAWLQDEFDTRPAH